MITSKILISLLVFGCVLMGAGLYSAQVYGYVLDPTTDDPQTSFTLGQWVYFQQPSGTRKYIGQLLGVYSVGTKMCMFYKVNSDDGSMTCSEGGLSAPGYPTSGWLQENAWGLLVNSPPDIDLVGEGLAPSVVYAIIPNMNSGNINGYVLAKLTGSDSAQGHIWTNVTPPEGMTNNAALGVELVLHTRYTYPDTGILE